MLQYNLMAELVEQHQILLEKQEKRIEELERIIVASQGARILLDGDLRVTNTTTLNGGILGGQ